MAKKRTSLTRNQRSRSVSPAFKASIHQLSGAGKRRVVRKFFGLSQSEQREIETLAGRRLDYNLRASEG